MTRFSLCDFKAMPPATESFKLLRTEIVLLRKAGAPRFLSLYPNFSLTKHLPMPMPASILPKSSSFILAVKTSELGSPATHFQNQSP